MSNFLPFVYCSAALLSLLLLIGCLTIIRKNRKWFVVLFSSVFVVNTGYSILAFSCDLQMALMANRIAYLGSVFLPLSMLIIISGIINNNIFTQFFNLSFHFDFSYSRKPRNFKHILQVGFI